MDLSLFGKTVLAFLWPRGPGWTNSPGTVLLSWGSSSPRPPYKPNILWRINTELWSNRLTKVTPEVCVFVCVCVKPNLFLKLFFCLVNHFLTTLLYTDDINTDKTTENKHIRKWKIFLCVCVRAHKQSDKFMMPWLKRVSRVASALWCSRGQR